MKKTPLESRLSGSSTAPVPTRRSETGANQPSKGRRVKPGLKTSSDKKLKDKDGSQETGVAAPASGVSEDASPYNVGSARSRTASEENVYYDLLPCSDQLDPFAQLPVNLNRFQEHLINFYLVDYPKATYGLSSNLKPHPVAMNFSIAMNNPPNFQVALARSALYRLSLHKYGTEDEKKQLELASIRHQGQAIQLVKIMATRPDANDHKDKLMAAIISLGTLDNRTGAKEKASLHFAAVRKILRSIGGPLHIKSGFLSTVMAHFECLYGTPVASYIWHAKDAKSLLRQIGQYFDGIWQLWKTDRPDGAAAALIANASTSGQGSPTRARQSRGLVLEPGTGLGSLFTRPMQRDVAKTTIQDKMKLIFQLGILLTLPQIVFDFVEDDEGLCEYMAAINDRIRTAQLEQMPCNNHLWLVQAHDQSPKHRQRVWHAVGFTWLSKHITYRLQLEMRDWLLAFMQDQNSEGQKAMKLEPFHFSYSQ